MSCKICGCPYPGDHAVDCPLADAPAPMQAREDEDEREDDTPFRLSDEGRSDGYGESYAERNA